MTGQEMATEQQAPSLTEASAALACTSSTLRLRFTAPEHAVGYVASLTSLLFASSSEVRVQFSTGRVRSDLDADESTRLLRRGLVAAIGFSVMLAGSDARIDLRIASSSSTDVELQLPISSLPKTRLWWLQCDPDVLAPLRTLAFPIRPGTFVREAAHGFVGLAARCGGFASASLGSAGRQEWVCDEPSSDALPLHGHLKDALWVVDGQTQGNPAAWFKDADLPADRTSPDTRWWARFDELVGASELASPELREHLEYVFRIPFSWELEDIKTPRDVAYRVPPELDVVSRIVPCSDRVVLGLDFQQPTQVLADLLLHFCAHCELGHLRPGDGYGHWDTRKSAASKTAYRRWDHEAGALLEAVCSRPSARRVASLEECTPAEKAWLVLLDHIGRMVGQTRTLHPFAERYQAAAYQRQAAQRLVGQLEDFGGAMLCDGVGLGKTYVATTVVVHYANLWRDRLAQEGRPLADDPFRVTILSPNSVVSTWQREAIPPLGAHGVVPAHVRVVSHTKLSRIIPNSEVLSRTPSEPSDMEHLLLSDLVVVDEAHNFRSVGARRTSVLRDLLRLQPRKDLRRKVLLLTATPVNNSLEDLRQQVALLFSKPLWFNDNSTPEGYRGRVVRDVQDRIRKAHQVKSGDVASILIHGGADARFSNALYFRDDLQFGVQVPRVGDYLKEQEKLLAAQQATVRAVMQTAQHTMPESVRIAGELLDRIVVQRSRALCKQIEREQGSDVRLLFRPDASKPEKLVYEDVYDDTRDVLARFLPLFDTDQNAKQGSVAPLSLKVYMWADVRAGFRDAIEVSSVVGLQRVLVLKRLESSPVAFLITVLRLLALHTHRLDQLVELCNELGESDRAATLEQELVALFDGLETVERDRMDLLLTGQASALRGRDLLKRWSLAHASAKAAAEPDDPPLQTELFDREDAEAASRRVQLDRVWALREELVRDFGTLLATGPSLADIVFGRFDQKDWPRKFINGGQSVDWPTSATWALRVVTDGKLRRLVGRLLRARADGQKAIVFSQFTDTLAYVHSVLQAANVLERREWVLVTSQLAIEAGQAVAREDVLELVDRVAVVSGETENRDLVIHAFAPFYRLGPQRPRMLGATAVEEQRVVDQWRQGWAYALQHPTDVLLATDVLAEGVNLQDAALLVNYDVHWNPVRMIQRAGRIDRRLNPAIEDHRAFPDLDQLAAELCVSSPKYWWHQHADAAPVTVNLLLPDALEVELQLRERIANKTLAIDFTLGLEQGTGAEAEWMADYRYQGVSALNAWEQDRAIERIAGYQERLRRLMADRGVVADWLQSWNGWLRETGVGASGRILAWAMLGRKGGELVEYTRHLTPEVENGVSHWLWTTAKPVESVLNFWLALDGKTFPAAVRTDIVFSMDASRPLSAEDLLQATIRVVDEEVRLEELGREVGRPVMQGASAISAGFLGVEADRRAIQVKGFRILELAQ